MANKVGLLTKQPLLASIHQQMKMAGDLLCLDAERFRAQHGLAGKPLTPKLVHTAPSQRIEMILSLQMGRHVPHDHVPPNYVSRIDYSLALLVNAAGPMWIRIQRYARFGESGKVAMANEHTDWNLLSEDGDVSKWRGDLWPGLWPLLMTDMENIVPDAFALDFLDGDLRFQLNFDPKYWVEGKCQPRAMSTLRVNGFDANPAVPMSRPAAKADTRQAVAA